MKTFLKAQTSSVVATLTDFCVTFACVQFLRINVVLSAAIGNVGGAIVNFMIGRQWVFETQATTQSKIRWQAFRYAIVWLGYMGLATAGIYLLETYTSLHYLLSKCIVGIVLAVGYNYYLQKKFVFN